MFARKNRFSFRNGLPKKVFSAQFFVIRYEMTNTEGLKCAVVVGKKVDKRAVERNRIKRITVSILKELIDKQNVRLVIIARPLVREADREEIKAELERIFKTIHIL